MAQEEDAREVEAEAEEGRPEDEEAITSRPPAGSRPRGAGGGDRVTVVALRLIDGLFYLVYALLGLRFLLTLLGAREGAGFTRLVHGITGPLYGPFEGIVARPTVDGGMVDFPLLIAILAYALLHIAIRGLVRTVRTATEEGG